MLKLSASAIVLTLGLLVASAIMAAQTARPEPHAQMNRALYAALGVAGAPVARSAPTGEVAMRTPEAPPRA